MTSNDQDETYPCTDCIYCGAIVPRRDDIPSIANDRAWMDIAGDHLKGCEWVGTRAHRIDEPAASHAAQRADAIAQGDR